MTVPGGGLPRLRWHYEADGRCTSHGGRWTAAVAPTPTGGYRATLVFDSGEERRWPEVGAQSQSAEHCRRWVRRVLVSTADRTRWFRADGRLPREGLTAPAGVASASGGLESEEGAISTDGDAHPVPHDYVGSTDAGRLLGVSRGTIARWAKEGRLPHARTLGGQARFQLADLQALAGLR